VPIVESIEIRNFRNLESVSIQPSPGINLITGPNASGKTSLLEAFFYLSNGRSFRSRHLSALTTSGCQRFRLQAWVRHAGQERISLGIERGRGTHRTRVAGRDAESNSELSQQLPLRLISPESHRLFEAGPEWRRRFLDWGVFHVKPSFLQTWRRYRSALRQRNAALRSGSPRRLVRTWESGLLESALAMESARDKFMEQLKPVWNQLIARLLDDACIEMSVDPGYPAGKSLQEALDDAWEHDSQRGFTRYGPHRMDLKLKLNGRPVKSVASRGQQKMLSACGLLAQCLTVHRIMGTRPVLLVDDLPAELDESRRAIFSRILQDYPGQVLVTATEDTDLSGILQPRSLFHVKQGEVSPVL
jgi:DNA replication and repair protein RecF